MILKKFILNCLAGIGTGTVCLCMSFTCLAQNNLQQQNDWLVNGKGYSSSVTTSPDKKELVLSNGLIERRFRITPNFACTGITNLVTGENYLRSIRPEAQVTLDGKTFDIGGLTGQPIQNYLLPEWTDKMSNDPQAFQFVKYSVENIKPRFAWKPRKEWISGDTKWPAPGKELVVEFKAPASISTEVQREVLYQDDFNRRDNGWNLYASKSNDRNSFYNEGKFGEIMANANVAVNAERDVPKDASSVECFISPGTDQSDVFGPGLTLVYPGNKTLRLFLKPGKKTFGIWDGNSVKEWGSMKEGAGYFLRITWDKQQVVYDISDDGKTWMEAGKINSPVQPTKVKVGKTDLKGGNTDGSISGEMIRCQVKQFSIRGKALQSDVNPSAVSAVIVKVHYEIYDGIPMIGKWISVHNLSGKKIMLDHFVSEIIAAVEGESSVEGETDWELPNFHVETDFAFSSMSNRKSNSAAVHWSVDSLYTSQVNYKRITPCLLKVNPLMGPAQQMDPKQSFESIRAWELYFDSYDKERKGLAMRKMYRLLAPWSMENPVLMHVRDAKPEAVKLAIDQCAEVGFEMVIMTFGSGFNMESGDTGYYKKLKQLADYAHSKGIALGGYSLLASRSISAKDDVINPETGKPGGIAYFGNSPCIGSEWGIDYFRKIKEMYEQTGLDIIEHDGSYPGDACASTTHPGHTGWDDSQWKQFKTITGFYQWCRSQGIYLNVPDWYYLNGSSKCAMGYREDNWSLPREQQEIIERQNIYDGTWTKTSSMGWMFVPLTQYHGGGAAATIEPLNDHLPHYNQRLANLFGAGVQACYRGPRLYDTDSTKKVVKSWVDFYKKHRRILDGDIIHLRRADGRDWDGILHVDPAGNEKGLMMIYNPLDEPITRNIRVPVYYTGLNKKVSVDDMQGKQKNYTVTNNEILIQVTLPAKGYQGFIMKDAQNNNQ